MPLSKTVLDRVRRLGGELAAGSEGPSTIAGVEVPEPLRQLSAIRWPAASAFASGEQDRLWVWALELGGLGPVPEGVRWEGGRPLACIGIADGGNDLLVVRLDDPQPSNPRVYKLDHDGDGRRLGNGVALSTFLRSLRIDEREAQRRADHGPATGPDAVVLSDEFRKAASLALNKQSPFSPADLARVRTLSVSYAGDLAELRHFPRLEHLAVVQSAVPSLEPLGHAPALRSLLLAECRVGDWSALSEQRSLVELHIPMCGLETLEPLRPLALEAATVAANPLGAAAAADLDRLPDGERSLSGGHPGALELALNDRLRARGARATCLRWQLDDYLLTWVPNPRAAGLGEYVSWQVVDAASFAEALDRGEDIATLLSFAPRAPATIDWRAEWQRRADRAPLHR